MITFVLYAISWVLGYPIPGSVYWLTGFVDGVVFLPLFTLTIVPLARIMREKFARIHYLQSVFPMDGVLLVLTVYGYEFAPLRDDDPEAYPNGYALLSDGTKIELDDDQTWYRLGNRRFGVTYQPDKRVLGDVAVDPRMIDLEVVTVDGDEEGEKQDVYAIIGDKGVLRKERGGFKGYTPFPDLAIAEAGDDDYPGFIASLSRAVNSLKGGGGVRLSEFTERMTRMEHGGGAQMSNRARAIAFTGVIFVGAVFGTVIFGVL